MNLPGLGAYTSYLPSGERAPDPDLGRLREQAQRHAENAPVIEQMLDTERRMSCVKAGLTMDQAQDLVQANWQLERAWELLREDAARFKLPVFWYAIGQALEATAMPRGSQDPDLTAERATRDHPYAMSRADAAQEAALILGHELAGVAPVSPRLRRFVQRILDPAEP